LITASNYEERVEAVQSRYRSAGIYFAHEASRAAAKAEAK
jgi:hypothetical protein